MIRQLHYSSVRAGPGGHSGFQFCARSEDVAEDTLRAVERLTAYERPREIDAGASLAQFPVNLVYAVLDAAGTAMIARVVYAGQDFSQRPGNYFAHALVTDDLPGDLGTLLPAQLWASPLWQTEPGPSAVLPALSGPLPVGRDLSTAAGVISAGADPAPRLARLLAAVDSAMNGGPRVLLLGDSSQQAWPWIAAVSALLGPFLAPAMSFCTYSHDPVRAQTHIVGTLVTSAPPAAQRSAFAVVDLLAEADPGDGSEPAFATLLARAGVLAAWDLWAAAARLGAPAGGGLAAWYPVLACALMSLGHELAPPDLDAAVDWLTGGQVSPGLARPVAASASGQRLGQLTAGRQARLVELMLAAGGQPDAGDDAGRLEEAIVHDGARRLASGAPPGEIARLGTRSGRAAGQAECRRLLPLVSAGRRPAVLRWAAEAGVEVAADTVLEAGRDVAVALVLGQADAADIQAVAPVWPALRAGMIERLAALPEATTARSLALLAEGTFESADFTGQLALGERWLSERSRARGAPAVQELIDVCELRRLAGRVPAADVALIRRLWPGGSWTAAEADLVARSFPPDELLLPPVVGMLAGALRDLAALDHENRRAWLSLMAVIETWPDGVLREYGIDFAAALSKYEAQVRGAYEGRRPPALVARAFLASYNSAGPEVQRYLDAEIPALILFLVPQAGAFLESLDQREALLVLRMAREHMAARPGDLVMAAGLWVCKLGLQTRRRKKSRDLEGLIDAVLTPAAVTWTRKQIGQFCEQAEQRMPGAADHFPRWIRDRKPQRSFFARLADQARRGSGR